MNTIIRKGIYSFWVICLLLSACEMERDNPLDPKNPDSSRDMVVVAELFVNDDMGSNYCNYALTAIENISKSYSRVQMVVIEYHLPYRTSSDDYVSDSFIPVYQKYVPLESERGLPDIFVNGASHRIQGASSVSAVQNRCETAVMAEINRKSYITIEANLSKTGSNFNISGKIACLGSSDISNVEIKAVLIEDIQEARHHFVARAVFSNKRISNLIHSERVEFTLSASSAEILQANNLSCIIYIQTQDNRIIGASCIK